MSIRVHKAGLLTTLQDGGRVGYAALGVGRAGPMDEVSFRLANALVGNDADAAALEISLTGPRLTFDAAAAIALAGAEFDARIGTQPMAGWRRWQVAPGDVLDCGRTRRGARAYLAVAGGFDAARVLGSRSCDVNAGLGPSNGRPLADGDTLTIAPRASPVSVHPRRSGSARLAGPGWALDPRPWFDPDPDHAIHLIRGRHDDALDARSREALYSAEFRIAAHSNRVGFRLDGPPLALAEPRELVSEAVAFGTLQLPPGGQPIALMAEHPTVGGYPRIGQVAAIDLPRLAQRRPGDCVRFRPIDLDEAQTRYLRRERELARMIEAIATRDLA